MVTLQRSESQMNNYWGLSTDVKPVTGVPNGSYFLEMDTGDMYFFDADSQSWLAV